MARFSVVVSMLNDSNDEELAQKVVIETADEDEAIATFEKLAGASFEDCEVGDEDDEDEDGEDDEDADDFQPSAA